MLEKRYIGSYAAQITHSSRVFTIISYYLLKEKYISKENIPVTDLTDIEFQLVFCHIQTKHVCNPDFQIDIMSGGRGVYYGRMYIVNW